MLKVLLYVGKVKEVDHDGTDKERKRVYRADGVDGAQEMERN